MQRYPLRFLVNRACDDDAGDEARPRRPTTRVNPRAPAGGLRSNVSHEARPGGRPLSDATRGTDAPCAESHEPEVHVAF
jgi:hypothetical protein